MNSKQAKWIATHPKAMMDFQARGKLPRMFRPESPLISLLDSIHPRDRACIRGVRLSPALGYQCGHQFHTAEQLYRWLKPQPEMIEGEPFPAESFRNKAFRKRLTLEDLKPHCAKWLD